MEAEPNALGFYERMGGRYLRDSEPSAWGRVIPLMGVDLPTDRSTVSSRATYGAGTLAGGRRRATVSAGH
jgi:hypothetical protein